MKYLFLAAAVIALSACEVRDQPSPHDFVCNIEQLAMVEAEMKVCKGTGYLASYCYLQSKQTLCTPIKTNGDKPCSKK